MPVCAAMEHMWIAMQRWRGIVLSTPALRSTVGKFYRRKDAVRAEDFLFDPQRWEVQLYIFPGEHP